MSGIMHILNPGPRSRDHYDVSYGRRSPYALYKLLTYSWLYLISCVISDYESDVSKVGNIPGILPYQFEPIRLDLPELWRL